MPNHPKPTVLKALEGTSRPDRVRSDEPKGVALELGAPPPAWVRGAAARRAWKALVEIAPPGLITQLDAMALGLLVNAFERYLRARDVVDGKACGLCGLPMTSKAPCTANVAYEEPAGEALEGQPHGGALKRRTASGRTVVTLPHEPGRPLYTTTTKEGSLMIRRHPAAAEALEWHEKLVGLLARFGMDPADRTRVGTGTPAGGEDPVSAFLGGRRTG